MMEETEPQSDWDLLEGCLHGNNPAWRVLHDRHCKSLYRTIRSRLHQLRCGPHSVDDIAQMVWFALLRKDYEGLRRYQHQRGCFSTYLREVAKQVIDLLNRPKGRQRVHEVPLEGLDRPDPRAENGLVQAEFAEYERSLSYQEKRCLHEKLLGEGKKTTEPPISEANERVLKHRMKKKWRNHFESP